MKIHVKSVSEILTSKVSIEQRGLLITALLCKDVDPKITLAKFKVYVDVKKYKSDMVFLQENNLLSWSGYKTAKKSLLKDLNSKDVYNVIEFMNNLYKRNFDPKAASSTDNLMARMKDYSIDQIKLVIANRYEKWNGDEVMEEHLNPTTVFRKSKFEKYLEEAERTKVGGGIVSVDKINLKNGDELNFGNTKGFIDTDSYNVKRYANNNGAVGNGVLLTMLGKEVKKSIKIQNNIEISVGSKEFVYTFVER